MKASNIFAAAACVAVMVAAPSIKTQLHAENYECPTEPEQELGLPVYEMKQANLVETIKYAGCPAIAKVTTSADITFYDSNIVVIDRGDGLSLTGEWGQGKAGQIHMQLDQASQDYLEFTYDQKALQACAGKFPSITNESGVISPSVLTTQSLLKVNGKMAGTLNVQMKGVYSNDGKLDKAGKPSVGAFSSKITVKGIVGEPQ